MECRSTRKRPHKRRAGNFYKANFERYRTAGETLTAHSLVQCGVYGFTIAIVNK